MDHDSSNKHGLIYFSNEFPGDDLSSRLRRLKSYSKHRDHPILGRFLDEATRALRQEVRDLRTELSQLVPDFESVINLAGDMRLRSGPLCGSIEGVLLCVLQLGTYIGYCESSIEPYVSIVSNTVLAGLGIGLLISTAISLSTSLEDVATSGVEVLRIAFRMGVYVRDVSHNLETMDAESPDSWAYCVYGLTSEAAQRELNIVHTRERTPTSNTIFISAVSETSVTVSGPPSRLKALFRTSGVFRDRKFTQLPVFGGLCHAPHIYTYDDAHTIVQAISLPCWLKPSLPVMSTNTGRPFAAAAAADLLTAVVFEIMTKQIVWEGVVHNVVERMIQADARHITLRVFRMSLPVQQVSTMVASKMPMTVLDTQDLFSWMVTDTAEGEHKSRGTMQSKIAIVGMSCRMPSGATDTEKFWKILEDGLDVHRRIPADRFDVDSHHDPTGKKMNTSHTAYGCFIDEPALFDAPFFNMSPREAEQTDPMQRLALVTAYEALERAGYVANRTPSTQLARIGTWYGQASDDYREVNTAQEISTYFIPGGCRAFGPGRINYFFKFSGPSFNCDTACSSSLATIQAACTALWAGDVDTVVAGGLNVLTNSDAFAGLCHGHFLTKTPNACKTWDGQADGYCRADGVGSIVMKRLDDAVADNDNILGVITAAATNHSANAVSITHPHAGHQADLYRKVMARADIDPLDVSYVEFHGTGTQAGDAEEMSSITEVFAPIKGKRRSTQQPLYIGAVKANFGHGEAAAGVTAMLKTLLMLQKGAIPPHVGIKTSINPGFPQDMDKRNLHIPLKTTEWPRNSARKRIAVVNNFSAAGGNTTIVLEEGPLREKAGSDPRSSHVIVLSAKSKISFKGNVLRLLEFLDSTENVDLADLAYTLTARRYHHNHRLAINTTSISALKQQLHSRLDTIDAQKPISSTDTPPVAFVFTGQGAAEKSMNLQLYRDAPYFRAQLNRLDALACRHGFPSFLPAINGSFPRDHEFPPVVTHVAHTCIQIALAKYWETLGVKPEVVMGHSLGEYAALYVAGVLSASDAIFLVGSRARLVEALCVSGSYQMMAVKASLSDIENVANGMNFDLACVNAPQETVLCGTNEQMEKLSSLLKGSGFRCYKLDVPFAFHSAQMDPILEEFEDISRRAVIFRAPTLPVLSPLLKKVVFDEKSFNASYLRRATRETVHFLSAMQKAQATSTVDKDTVWIEIGPHPVCTAFVRASAEPCPTAVGSFRRGEDNWATLAESLGVLHCAGVQIRWDEFHKPFEGSLRLLDLPTYSWNDKKYWIQYRGDWALTKGNTFYADRERATISNVAPSSIRTATVQHIIEETSSGSGGKVVMQSDLMQPEFLAAAHGHKMNGCGVVTSSIHADIVYTLGEYLYKMMVPISKGVAISIDNLQVTKGLVAQNKASTPQLIRVTASTADINTATADFVWENLRPDGNISEPFATCQIRYSDAEHWLSSWAPRTHLIHGRIDALKQLADQGVASRFSHNMAYTLFAHNLVDYADKYRGMQVVVMNNLEAYAEVTLKDVDNGGNYTVPPYFIDSVAHLAGFVMNVSDASDTANTFCVTPGWNSMRFALPLTAGQKYQSYVKMIPTSEDPSVYFGDVYILQKGAIIGMVEGIQFRRYPRILLSRFFSTPDSDTAKAHSAGSVTTLPKPIQMASPVPMRTVDVAPLAQTTETAKLTTKSVPVVAATTDENSDSTARKALLLVAKEGGLDIADLTDDAEFANLGVDSLMSLVIAEKFREELGVNVAGSLFLEYPTIGALRAWLEEYYS
ncbi:putative polyketide synthase [Phaeosphaeriaceae sp. PMI808]|nr:putative polyketide synthase [Phaeosphaeriaceae sp. PMI808]